MDNLLFRASTTDKAMALLSWFDSFEHGCLRPDYHRLQIERWLFEKLHRSSAVTIDIAQDEAPRLWLEMENYKTFGLSPHADIRGDLLGLSRRVKGLDAIICTEVLEHCTDPWKACKQMHKALKKGGTLYVVAPFCWPDHATDAYDDYWRFTQQGYELMLQDFDEVDVQPIEWTDEGFALWNLVRRFECMGATEDVSMHTGYVVEARK